MRIPTYAVPLLLASSALATPTLQQMLGFLQQFSLDFSYPQIIQAAQSINYTRFADDIVGRVDVTGTFMGRELNTEYIFGLFSGLATGSPKSTPLVGIPLNGTLVDLVVENNVMIATTRREFNWTVAIVPTLWQVKFMFNDEGLVTQYDAILYRASALFANIWPKLAKRLKKELGLPRATSDNFAIHTRAARDVCSQHEKYCLGPNKQYKSIEACMEFVLHKIPLGEVWQGGQNTAFCRYVHTPMLPLRPSVHCPHVGPTGGDMCFDHSYESLLENPFAQPFSALPDNLTLAALGL
ncbi:hypothetical protein MSAN_00827700 [Mycena sanguinolenta]|uniref:Uncharacterized protein n=1 Tax=Mycena sanguinolenta TaxID=230812 RepID=A0A8H6Z0I6_9AGAR|nr:hypothetical protein MSAN_00827700 [Mycena sanguinolenta]